MWRRQTGRLCRLGFDGERMTAHTGQNNGSNRKTFLLLPVLPGFWYGSFFVILRFRFRYFCWKSSRYCFHILPVRQYAGRSVFRIRFHQAVYNP